MKSRFLALMRFGHLAVPGHVEFMDSAVKNAVQYILIVHDDAFVLLFKKMEKIFLYVLTAHGVEIHKKKSGIEVACQPQPCGLFVFIDVLHGCGNAVFELRVPQRRQTRSANHIAVHIDTAGSMNERRNKQPVVGGQTDVVLFRDIQGHAGKKIGRNGEELDLCPFGFRHFADAATLRLGYPSVQYMKEQ